MPDSATHVVCKCCNNSFCTDCQSNHPGEDCNDFLKKVSYWEVQACPSCCLATSKIDGDHHMWCCATIEKDGILQQCNTAWCWRCRCFMSDEEMRMHQHECLIDDKKCFPPPYDHTDTHRCWMSNPVWMETQSSDCSTKVFPLEK